MSGRVPPHFGAHLNHPLRHLAFFVPVLVFPSCNLIPARLKSLSANFHGCALGQQQLHLNLLEAKEGLLARLLHVGGSPVTHLPHPANGNTKVARTPFSRMELTHANFLLRGVRSTWHFGAVSPNAINRKHRRSGVQISDCSDCMADAIHSCSGGKCELEWSANPLHFLSELTRQCFGNESAKTRSCGDSTHPSVVLWQRRHGCQREHV